jgi:predicted nucleotidyltransferase
VEPLNREDDLLRLAIAREVIDGKRQELGELFVAAAVYGSVAHGASLPGSDVELTIVVDDAVAADEEYSFVRDIMVECSIVPRSQLLAAARRVTWSWAIQADAYRHQLVIDDPADFFLQVRAAAHDLAEEDFAVAQKAAWWRAYEVRGKFHNALLEADCFRAAALGWEFAGVTAMRIGLNDRVPYESSRTLWADAAGRGHGMVELLDRLVEADLEAITHALDHVWEQTESWGARPSRPPIHPK